MPLTCVPLYEGIEPPSLVAVTLKIGGAKENRTPIQSMPLICPTVERWPQLGFCRTYNSRQTYYSGTLDKFGVISRLLNVRLRNHSTAGLVPPLRLTSQLIIANSILFLTKLVRDRGIEPLLIECKSISLPLQQSRI